MAKLRVTLTGDTLGDKSHEIFLEPVPMPEPAMTYAIEPKSRADEDKLAPALHKVMEEDSMVRFFRDPQTNEFLVAGAGQQHIEAVVSKLKRRYHTDVTLKAPKIPYRETVRGNADVPRHRGAIRNRRAGMVSMATARFAWRRCRVEAEWCLRTTFLAAPFRGSTFLRWRRGFASRLRADFWRDIRWSISR